MNQPQPEPAVLLNDPDYLLFDLRSGQNTTPDLLFARVQRATFYASAFLDHRIEPRPSAFFRLGLRQASNFPGLREPDLFIGHTSFCCSTLLARCLQDDALLSLREPRVLSMVANEYRRGHVNEKVDPLARICLQLLGKRYASEQKVAVKMTNFTNNLLGAALRLWPQQKILLMWGGIEDFMVSMCKHENEATRNLGPFLQAFLIDAGYTSAQQQATLALPLLHQAVWAWSLQVRYFVTLLETYPQLKTLAANDFLDRPGPCVKALHEWCGANVTTEQRRRQIEATMGKDAKKSALAAPAGERRREIFNRRRSEIEDCLAWAREESILPDTGVMKKRALIVAK